MTTNTPPRKYGYTLPSLGGEGMGRKRLGDLFFNDDSDKQYWEPANNGPFVSGCYYCRPIDVGPEHELVGEDESSKGCEALTYRNEWKSTDCCSGLTVKEFIEKHPAWVITAVRRRKVVKDAPSLEVTKGVSILPMDTAPKDGTYILLFADSGYLTSPLRCGVCKYDKEYRPLQPWVNHANDSFLDGGGEPIGWLPLPTPLKPQPKTQAELDEEWIKKHVAGMVLNEANVSDSLLEAIAYARALDKAK